MFSILLSHSHRQRVRYVASVRSRRSARILVNKRLHDKGLLRKAKRRLLSSLSSIVTRAKQLGNRTIDNNKKKLIKIKISFVRISLNKVVCFYVQGGGDAFPDNGMWSIAHERSATEHLPADASDDSFSNKTPDQVPDEYLFVYLFIYLSIYLFIYLLFLY